MIKPGQIYEACIPLGRGGRRIRIADEPITTPGLYGFGKVDVHTIDDNGRQLRRRRIEITQLHESGTTKSGAPRRTGYRLVTDAGRTEEAGGV